MFDVCDDLCRLQESHLIPSMHCKLKVPTHLFLILIESINFPYFFNVSQTLYNL